jgi:hypothetical protein
MSQQNYEDNDSYAVFRASIALYGWVDAKARSGEAGIIAFTPSLKRIE